MTDCDTVVLLPCPRHGKSPAVQVFTILNFEKPGSLFQKGMKPLIYSEKAAASAGGGGGGYGWHRAGREIYYREGRPRPPKPAAGPLHHRIQSSQLEPLRRRMSLWREKTETQIRLGISWHSLPWVATGVPRSSSRGIEGVRATTVGFIGDPEVVRVEYDDRIE